MKIEYFRETDSPIMRLSDEPAKSTRMLSDDMNADIGASGNIVALEIHQNAREILSLNKLRLEGIDQDQLELVP